MNCLAESMYRKRWTKNCTDPPPPPENFYDRLVSLSTGTSSALKGRPKSASGSVILQNFYSVQFGRGVISKNLSGSVISKILSGHSFYKVSPFIVRSVIFKSCLRPVILPIAPQSDLWEFFFNVRIIRFLISSGNSQSMSNPKCSLRENVYHIFH